MIKLYIWELSHCVMGSDSYLALTEEEHLAEVNDSGTKKPHDWHLSSNGFRIRFIGVFEKRGTNNA